MGRTIVISLTLVSLAGIVAGTIITSVHGREAIRAHAERDRGAERVDARLTALEERLEALEAGSGT